MGREIPFVSCDLDLAFSHIILNSLDFLDIILIIS